LGVGCKSEDLAQNRLRAGVVGSLGWRAGTEGFEQLDQRFVSVL